MFKDWYVVQMIQLEEITSKHSLWFIIFLTYEKEIYFRGKGQLLVSAEYFLKWKNIQEEHISYLLLKLYYVVVFAHYFSFPFTVGFLFSNKESY